MLRPCLEPGCPNLSEQSRCAIHRRDNRSPSSRITGTRRWRDRTKPAVLARDNWTCRYCGAHADQVDHVDPVSRGGDPWDKDGLVACCSPCNARKNAKRGGEGPLRGPKRTLRPLPAKKTAEISGSRAASLPARARRAALRPLQTGNSEPRGEKKGTAQCPLMPVRGLPPGFAKPDPLDELDAGEGAD
jgi:5-methylcytosine-specific restriction endonuclease McrA